MRFALVLAFSFVVYSSMVVPGVIRTTPNYFDESRGDWVYSVPKHLSDFQLPMGPVLSKHIGDEIRLIVLIRIPSIIIFFCILGSLIFCLRVPILALTSMLPSVIQRHPGRFIRAIERRESLHPLPFRVAVLIQISKSPKDIL